VLRRLPIEIKIAIAVRQFNIDKLQRWLGAIQTHAMPQPVRIRLNLDIYGVPQAKFDIDLSNSEAHWQRNLGWLGIILTSCLDDGRGQGIPRSRPSS